jgi:PKD repeat protein
MNGITVNEDEEFLLTGMGSDTEGDEDSLQYSWDLGIFGVSKTDWDDSPDYSVSYSKSGIYTAVLRVKDNDGAVANDSVKITVVNVAPTAEFFAGTGKLNEDEMEIFNAETSSDTPSDIRTLNYTWDFGDGSPIGYGMKPIHGYFKSGEYSVKLTVTDDDDESDVHTKKIRVLNQEPICQIRATETRVYTGYSITFTVDKVSDTKSDLKNLTFAWDFGDKTYEKGQAVTHSYSEPGSYYVRLTVEDDDKAKYSTQIEIRVLEIEEPEIERVEDTADSGLVVPTLIIVIILIIILLLLMVIYFRKPDQNKES